MFSTHIISDLEKCADLITYIHNGKILTSTDRDTFTDAYRKVTGGKEELTPDYGWEQEAPAEEIESTAREYAELGAVFTLGEDEDDFTTVNDVWMDDNDRLHVIVTQEETYQSFPNLCSMDSDGNENWLWLEDIKDTDKGEYTFECVYDLSYAPHDNMWLVFYGVDREVWMGIEPTI